MQSEAREDTFVHRMDGLLIHLLILGVIALAFLPAFIVCCFEKKAIRMFEPCGGLKMTAYMQNSIDRALVNGFSHRCYGRHIKYRDTLFGVLMISPDRRMLALIAGGGLGKLAYSLTILISRCRDGTILITYDSIGIAELDRLTDAQSSPRGFDRILQEHVKRLDAQIAPEIFPANADWTCVDKIYWEKTDRIVERGLAKYVGGGKDYIRFTLRGSFWSTMIHGLKIIHRPIWLARRAVARPA